MILSFRKFLRKQNQKDKKMILDAWTFFEVRRLNCVQVWINLGTLGGVLSGSLRFLSPDYLESIQPGSQSSLWEVSTHGKEWIRTQIASPVTATTQHDSWDQNTELNNSQLISQVWPRSITTGSPSQGAPVQSTPSAAMWPPSRSRLNLLVLI